MTNPTRGLRPFRPTRFGRYTLLTPIATGGMGAVFLARMAGVEGFEKLVVIKKILPFLAREQDFVERFVDEAKIVVKLHHGSIAQVLDMGVENGEYYIAMEFVDGKDVRKLAARARDTGQRIPPSLALYLAIRVLDALAYAHRKKDDQERELNLVHRDISPQNILVSYEGEVKIIDFGLAKSAQTLGRTNPSVILGKFFYMSPEQARHQGVDRRSDLYAAGICLWELLAGRNPFDDLRPGEIMRAVTNPQVPRIKDVVPGIPDSLDQALMKALAVDPAARYATAEEMRGRLTAVMLEIDPSAGPEALAGFMRRQFAREYDNERRAIAALARVKVPEAEVADDEPAPAAFPDAPRERRDLTAVAAGDDGLTPPSDADATRLTPMPRRETPPRPRPPLRPAPIDSIDGPTLMDTELPASAREPLRPAPSESIDGPTLMDTELPSSSEVILVGASSESQDDDSLPDLRATAPLDLGEGADAQDPTDPEPMAEPLREPAAGASADADPAPGGITAPAQVPAGRGWLVAAIGAACLAVALAMVVFVFKPLARSDLATAPVQPALSPVVPLQPPPPQPEVPPAVEPAAVAQAPSAEPAAAPDAGAPEGAVGETPTVAQQVDAQKLEPERLEPENVEPVALPKPVKAIDKRERRPEAVRTSGDARLAKRRASLERLYNEASHTYETMRQVYPCEQLGFVCKVIKPEVERSYERMIASPADYDDLERLLGKYTRALEDRRRILGMPGDR